MHRTMRGKTEKSGFKPFDFVVVCYVAKVLIQGLPTASWKWGSSPHLSHENQLPLTPGIQMNTILCLFPHT